MEQGSLFDEKGNLKFSNSLDAQISDFVGYGVENDTVYTITATMEEFQNGLELPAGTFDDNLNLDQEVLAFPRKEYPHYPKYLKRIRSKGIGVVLKECRFIRNPRDFVYTQTK